MLMMPNSRRFTRKDMYTGIGRRRIQQRYAPRNFAEEVEIAIEHSFDPGMQPVTAEEEAFLRNLAAG